MLAFAKIIESYENTGEKINFAEEIEKAMAEEQTLRAQFLNKLTEAEKECSKVQNIIKLSTIGSLVEQYEKLIYILSMFHEDEIIKDGVQYAMNNAKEKIKQE